MNSTHEKEMCIYEEGHKESGCHCHRLEVDQDSESNYQQGIFDPEAQNIQECDMEREKQLEDACGEYVDMQPCLPPTNEVSSIQLPEYLSLTDRVDIKAKMVELEMSRENAKEMARYYRDRCSELQIKNKKLEAKNMQIQALGLQEKQKVRYFWRNQVLEGQSRSGRILKRALS